MDVYKEKTPSGKPSPRPAARSSTDAGSPGNKPSRIPVRRQSLEEMLVHEDGVMRVQDLLGLDNPAMNRASTDLNTSTGRTPRYGLGAYQSYEELLRNMEDTDPFHGEPPPSSACKEPKQQRQSSRNHIALEKMPPKHTDDANTGSSKHHQRHKRKRSHRDKSPKTAPEKLNSTFTKEKKSSRPESAKTYVIERTDSQAELIPSGRRVESVAILSPIGLRKKVLMDTRKEKAVKHHLNENAIRDYVRNHIKHRQCAVYIKDAKKKEGDCQCGRNYAWHETTAGVSLDKAGASEKWDPEKHTSTMVANTYGTIQFFGFGQEPTKHSPYIRIDHKTKPRVVWELLSDYWQLPNPKLIISVTGGAKRFFMKARLKTSFKRGLINAATTTGAWIVTGGTNAGVMEFVGEAVRDHMLTTGITEQQVVALGVATWGIVDNKDSLISDDGEGMFPAYYNIDDLSAKSAQGLSPLDCNHTHFILVDNGTEKKFGAEIKFRAALEHYISEMMETGVARNQSVHVPVVLLVLEGGENTLQTTAEAMITNTPVVVIQGSGRAADCIAYAYRITRSADALEEKTLYPPTFEEDLRAQAQVIFDWTKETDLSVRTQKIDMIVTNMKLIMDRRRLLTVFNLDDSDTTNEIDQAILYALLKANRSDAQSQLNLALAWNRCDVARTEIFNIENRSQWQKMNLYDAMFTALVQDRADFVQLFLDNGVDLKRFLTIKRLRDIYDDVIQDKYAGSAADLFRHLLQHVQQNWMTHFICCKDITIKDDLPNLLSIVGKVLHYLLGDQAKDLYSDPRFVVTNEASPSKTKDTVTSVQQYSKSGKSQRFTVQAEFANPERELFLWAVLLNRRELAMLFWRQGKDHIGAALTASALLKALAECASNDEELDLATDLFKHSQMYEELGVGVLTECYKKDKLMTHQLLTRELTLWGNHTLFMIAENGEQMDFMEHSACQTKLNKIWKGKMALYTSTWKILLVIFCPLFLPLVKFAPFEISGKKPEEYTNLEDEDPEESSDPIPAKNQVSPSKEPDSGDDKEFVPARLRRQLTKKLYNVALCGSCRDSSSINIFQAIFYYHTAPVTKFWCHTIAYLCFLFLFSGFIMTNLYPLEIRPPGIVEYIVWGWNATLIIEEIRQLVTKDSRSLSHKLADYFSNVWNRFDMATHMLFMTSIVLRVTLPPETFHWARMMYASTVAMYFLRFMQIFFVEKNIGPKVIMISRMLTDLMFFIAILLVVMLAYGVASQALRYPNSLLSWSLIVNIFYLPYWQMHGELFLDELEGHVSPCSRNATEITAGVPRCPENSWLVVVMFAFYMIMTNVLLLNLLIAMFSYTFERVQENSEKVWRFYRHALIYEYFDRPTLAPPLIIFSHMWRILRFCIKACRKSKESSDFRNPLSDDENKKLSAFEKGGMENYLLKQLKLTKEHIDAKVTSTGERLEKVILDLEQIKEQVTQPGDLQLYMTNTASVTKESPPKYDGREDLNILQSRMTGLEEQLQMQAETMRQMMTMMQVMAQSPRLGYVRNVPEPQIEIRDMGDTGSSTHTNRHDQ